MAYVEVDIDLEDFKTLDIIQELYNRKRKKKLSKKQLDELDDFFERESYDLPTGLVDKMKMEVIMKHYNDIPYDKICQFFEDRKGV
jgi:hypothetical protein